MAIIGWILLFFIIVTAVATAGHALLYKRDPRAAFVWIAWSLIYPPLGSLLYFLFGINRVRSRAKRLESRSASQGQVDYESANTELLPSLKSDDLLPEFKEIARISDSVTRKPLLGGNDVSLLENGEQAYPAMLDAINRSESYIFLSTYIFETNMTGMKFIGALADAVKRGLDVRVMIDGMGELYSNPRAGKLLEKNGVRVSRFIPPKLIPPTININLRNHRKIMVVDGVTGFVGGMNIGNRHLVEDQPVQGRVVDLHFRLKGPVVSQIEQVFLEDWAFSSGEDTVLKSTPNINAGSAICRAIVDGPNEDLDKLSTIIISTVSTARKRIIIVSPYFVPPRELVYALQGAALRGVEVDVILPEKSNLPFVDWATRNILWEVLQRGVRVFFQPPPFAHTKLFIVDDYYAQIGSANMDPRSLRLNFELTVELFDRDFVKVLTDYSMNKRNKSSEISLGEVDSRPLPVRARDALAWLFSPYL